MSDQDPAIRTVELGRDFGGQEALHALDLAVARGEIYAFLGPNGAGKTTTVRILTGLLRPSRGRAFIFGLDVLRDADAARKLRAFVPDTPPLFDHLTVWQYIAFVAGLWQVDPVDRDREIAALLPALELDAKADELCKSLSHGTKKKVVLAAMLAVTPRVLFLDEPTSGLDPRSSRRMKDLLRERAQAGTTIFLTTHRLELAEEVADRVGILSKGRLIAEGSVADLRLRTGDADLEDVFLRLTEESDDASSVGG